MTPQYKQQIHTLSKTVMLEQPSQSLQLTNIKPSQESAKQPEPIIQQPSQPEEPRSCLWYFLSWVIFLIAVGVYIGIWAISNFAVTTQASYYYSVDYPVSPYLQSNANIAYCDKEIVDRSATLHNADSLKEVQAIALALVFSWMMWKLPLAIFMLYLIFQAQHRILKYVSWSICLALMLAADIVLTIFIPTIYQDFMFFAFTALLSTILTMINNRPGCGAAFFSSFLPYFYIALLYFFYSYLIPSIFNQMVRNVDPGYDYLMIYGYPVLDVILYGGLLFINSKNLERAKPMLAAIQFYIIGYGVGITLLASMTQVEFYYLVAYMLFRNFFTNWIMWKWENVVNNPPCLPGWGIVYYLSYIFNFLPVIGLGPLVLSKSFKSQQFSQSCLLLSYYPSTQYPYSTSTPSYTTNNNYSLAGFIYWPAALIIWGVTTFTQQYPRRKPTLFDLFFNLVGIYMFYLGISGGLQLLTLRQVGIF